MAPNSTSTIYQITRFYFSLFHITTFPPSKKRSYLASNCTDFHIKKTMASNVIPQPSRGLQVSKGVKNCIKMAYLSAHKLVYNTNNLPFAAINCQTEPGTQISKLKYS
eukprot:TRINITY_DN19599_c0_g1_i1.p1 TRINITY_DN19599_c0_g1~~TRINITY_DN19599_c0_g1_i1.p1  ORF type:complete len:108 (+),score=4.94 TRINITY_DN19599_c0_g1_i1:759-1082(+)